jgi:hypothetical protein
MAIAFITWLWGSKYDESDVAKLAHGVRRNYQTAHRFVVFTDRALKCPPPIEVKPIADPRLIGRGCFCRLRMFDPRWQRQHGFNDRVVSLDLDAVICGDIAPLVERPESFLILQGVNASNPCPFNASVMMLREREHAHVWTDFTPEKASAVPFDEFPDDQAWIWHKLPKAAGWKAGETSGIYGFQKPGWPRWAEHDLPIDARIVAFFGWRKPSMFTHLPWVRVHWRAA